GRLRDGSLVGIAKTSEAFEEDCRRAVLVVSARDAPPGCAAPVIDRQVWQRSGAMALRRLGERFEITASRPLGYDRPWRRAVAPESDAPAPPRAMPPQPRDATPREDDREAGDRGRCPASRQHWDCLIASEQPDQLALDAHAVGREDSDLIGGIGGLERNRGTAAAETLEGRLFFVDQRHHNVARIRPPRPPEPPGVASPAARPHHAFG